MKLQTNLIAATLALSIGSAFAAGSPGVEHTTQAFLEALEAGNGKPLETLAPKDARAVLVGAQAGVKVDLSGTRVEKKSIEINGQPLELTLVRPEGAKGDLPVFMFFHGGGWVLGDYPTHERLIHDLVVNSGAVAVYVNYTPRRKPSTPPPSTRPTPPPNGWPSTTRTSASTARAWRWPATASAATWRRWWR